VEGVYDFMKREIASTQLKSTILPTSERLVFLDNLRAIAIIMVIAVHALGYSMVLPNNVGEVILFIVQTASVPAFFLVDGYLFARSVRDVKSYNYVKYVRNSVFRLLVPWVAFTLVYTLARYAFELSGYLKEKLIVGHSLQDVVISAYGSVYAPQLYFLCSLFLIRLCAPLFRRVLFVKNYCIVLLVFFCYYAGYRSMIPIVSMYLKIDGGSEPLLHALWGAQFYLAGIVVFLTAEMLDLKKLFMPFLLFFGIVLIIENNYGGYGLNYLVQYVFLLTFVLFFTLFQSAIPFVSVIGRNTMGIFLIHAPMVLNCVALIVNKFVYDPMLSLVFILVGTFVTSICMVMVINSFPYGCLLLGAPYLRKGRLQASTS
jgi:surface polysaccharide O-acyltransferase-like enzyme